MPIYEFICTDCHVNFERIMSFAASQKPVCVACGSEHTQRKLSAPAIHFKGGGFYLTESRKEADAKSEKEAPEKNESKASEGETVQTKSQDSNSGSGSDTESGSSSKSNKDKQSGKAASGVSKTVAKDG